HSQCLTIDECLVLPTSSSICMLLLENNI
ncbi:hypothetical protein GCK32_004220, partial [Trichostrongylus colubriformis]